MRDFFSGLSGRVLLPVLMIVIVSAGSAYLLIERIVISEIRLKAEETLRADAERISGRLRSDYTLLFHAFGGDSEQFERMAAIAQAESLEYLNKSARNSKVHIYVRSKGALLLPKNATADDEKDAERIFGLEPCEEGKKRCLAHTLGFAPWDWQIALYAQEGLFFEDARRTIGILMTVISVMALLISLTIVWVIRAQVRRPLGEILTRLDDVGRGEFKRLDLKGSQEMKTLADHLEQMVGQIRRRENEIRQSEERYRQLSTHLEERVQNEMQKRASEQKMLIQNSRVAAMGEMIGAVAHHWRQPLNTLAVTVQDIQDAWRYRELDEVYLDTNVARCMKQINELSETIDNFRNFFRADTEAEPFELNKSVTQTLALLEAEMDNHRIDIEFQRPDTPVIVRGYPTQLRQALLNLLINAKDAIVLNKAEPGRIRIRLHTEKSRTLLTVCDNGGGIPESIMGRIFDPFFSTKEAGKGVGVISGSGVGLYMTKLIIEENFKGRIEVLNAQEGACFTLILPMAQ